jgi:hypothetical protein
MLAQYADEVCLRCNVRLKGPQGGGPFFFVHPYEAPEENPIDDTGSSVCSRNWITPSAGNSIPRAPMARKKDRPGSSREARTPDIGTPAIQQPTRSRRAAKARAGELREEMRSAAQQQRLQRLDKTLTDYQDQAQRPFEHEARLKELARQDQLNAALDLDKSDAQAAEAPTEPDTETMPAPCRSASVPRGAQPNSLPAPEF